jgi:serine/threonine-protein kinase
VIDRLSAALAPTYRVERELGAGGMATVYLAHDVKHDRDVAIKVLHEDLGTALGADRFLAEIRTTARLQHPHILPLLDSGSADGLLYYVMPYVRGETLRARLERERQLPLDDALRVAREVADALGAAHAQGIVHRDIKPENILLQDGHALVADFGIALAVQSAGGARMTQTGLSLGTPSYMSPEQAMGERALDARADLYALGAVTYEMLSGEPPFTGASVQAIVARLLSERPTSLTTLRDTVPASVNAAVMRCLAKLPADRFASAADFTRALGARDESLGAPASAPRVTARTSRGVLIAAALACAALPAAWWLGGRRAVEATAQTKTAVRFEVDPAPGTTIIAPRNGQPVLALSPDGNQVVFSAGGSTGSMLYRRSVGDLLPTPIAGTDFAEAAAFSPDGRYIAVAARGRLLRLALDGSSSTVVTEVGLNGVNGLTWISNDEIVFGYQYLARSRQGLWRVRASGGEPVVCVRPFDTTSTRGLMLGPVSVGDGDHVLFTAAPAGVLSFRLGLASVRTGESRLIEGAQGSAVLGMAGNKVVFARSDGALIAATLDLETAVASDPVVLRDSAAVTNYFVAASLSRSGSLLVAGTGRRELVRVDLQGNATPLLPMVGGLMHPRLSPDATRLVVDDRDGNGGFLWIADLRSGTTDRTASDDGGSRPEWSPDGRRLVYPAGAVNPNADVPVRWRPVDGGTGGEDLWRSKDLVREVVMAPDGGSLLVRIDAPKTGRDILRVDLRTREVTPLVATDADEKLPRLSPDGRWLAYTSDESGATAVYVRRMTKDAGRTVVSAGAGAEPVWSRDGRRLFYRVGASLHEATLTFGEAATVTSRRQLFDGRYETDLFHASYDVFPDGKSFVMVRAVADSRRLVLVRDWAADLEARIPTR